MVRSNLSFPYKSDHSSVVQILVVFTKLDILRVHWEHKIEKQLEEQNEDIDDDEFDTKVDAAVGKAVEELCVQPLSALTNSPTPKYPYAMTSSKSPFFVYPLPFLPSIPLISETRTAVQEDNRRLG